jgi:hypothetical protein
VYADKDSRYRILNSGRIHAAVSRINIITMDRLTQQCICQQVVLYTNTNGGHVSV